MTGGEGAGQQEPPLFQYPVPKKWTARDRLILLALFLIPLLAVLMYRWPLEGMCLVVWVIFTILIVIFSLTNVLDEGAKIEVHRDRMRVRAEEFHPDQLEYIETYHDEGHVGNKVEKRPHYVFIFHWTTTEGLPQEYELLLLVSQETWRSIIGGLKEAIPGIRVLELPEKKLRLRK